MLSTIAFGGEEGGEKHKVSPYGLSLTAGVKRTDNRDAISEDEVISVRGVEERIEKADNTEYWITPTISFRKEWEDGTRFYAGYSPTYKKADNPRDDSVESEWEHAIRADADLYLGPRTKLMFSDNFWCSGQKDWHYGDDFEFSPRNAMLDDDVDRTRNDDFYQNRLDAELSRTLTADDKLNLGGQWRIKRYDEDKLAAFGDEEEYVFYVNFMRRASRHIAYGVFVEYTAFDRANGEGYEPEPIEGNETPRVDTGVEYVTSGLQLEYDASGNGNILFFARTGYKYVWYEASGIDDDETIGDTRAELILYKYERTSARLGVKYGREFADIYPYSSQDNTTFYGTLSHLVDRRGDLRLSADFEYRMRTYELEDIDPDSRDYTRYFARLWEATGEDGKGDRDSIWLRLSATYQWSPKFTTSAFYSYEEVESDVDTSYTENTFGLRATYRFL
ncbi:MAG: hypothetical protein ACOX9C_00340 [Kiritimatiellia bacterium]